MLVKGASGNIWVCTQVSKSHASIGTDNITTTKQSTAKPCAYFMGYTVYHRPTSNLHDRPTSNLHDWPTSNPSSDISPPVSLLQWPGLWGRFRLQSEGDYSSSSSCPRRPLPGRHARTWKVHMAGNQPWVSPQTVWRGCVHLLGKNVTHIMSTMKPVKVVTKVCGFSRQVVFH